MALEIIGRGTEYTTSWEILKEKSMVLVSLRRMGKTYLLKKLAAEPLDDWLAIFYPVQGKKSPEEIVHGLNTTLIEMKIIEANPKRLTDFYDKFLGGKKIKGYELPNLKQHWKDVLTRIVETVAASQQKVVLLLDEFPWMLYEFITSLDLANPCMELLDVMRTLREQYESNSNIRFVFCGSIGLNVVLNKLKRDFNYMGNPVNNMYHFVLLEMNEEDATSLCNHLLDKEERLVCKEEEREELIDYLIEQTQQLPFYLDLLFKGFSINRIKELNQEVIDEGISELIRDVSGNGNFDHFRERIESYYEKGHAKLADRILVFLCQQDQALPKPEILKGLNQLKETDSRLLSEVLKALLRDLYLEMDKNGYYRFRYQLLKDWWRLHYS